MSNIKKKKNWEKKKEIY